MSTSTTPSGVWSLVSGKELESELRRRKPQNLFSQFKSSPRNVASAKRSELEANGWELDKRLKSAIRMKKAKPIGDALEDAVWALLAGMGFDEMNKGRKFQIPIGSSIPKQIDVFAKDELSALIVSCKENAQWGPRSLQAELESLSGLKSRIQREVREHYGGAPPHFVGFVIATRNVQWSSGDEKRAKEFGIKVLRDEELIYFSKLASLIGPAARYQLMGELFPGQHIGRMANNKVAAIQGRYRDTHFYQFVVDAETLARIGFVQHRARLDRSGDMTYQRLIKKSRLKSISDHINSNQVFPTNIVVNIHDSKLVFEQASKSEQFSDDLKFGTLTLPSSFKSAWIIDGQHRLYIYFHENTEKSYRTRAQLPVIAFDGLSPEDEANLFIDINNKQVKVSRDLLYDLNADLRMDSNDPRAKLNAIATKIVLQLGQDRSSPIYNRVKSERSASESFLNLPQIVDAIKRSGLIGTVDTRSKQLLPGPFYGDDKPSTTVDRAFKILCSYLSLFSIGAKKHWALKNKQNRPDATGGHLCTSPGISTLILLLGALVKDLGKWFSTDFRKKTEDEIIKDVEIYVKPVISYFQDPSYEDIYRFRIYLGSSAPLNGMREMQAIIRNAEPTYNPEGLDEFLKRKNQDLVNELNQLYRPLEEDLLEIIITYLKGKFGSDTGEWFLKGTPPAVKERVMSVQNKDVTKNIEECFTMPIDGKLIMEFYKNDFQSILKVPDLQWFNKLDRIRNGISHAPYNIEPDSKEFLTIDFTQIVERGKKSVGL